MLMGMKPDSKTLNLGGVWVDARLTDTERKDTISGILEMVRNLSDSRNWEIPVGNLIRS